MAIKPLSILYTEAATAYWGQERYVHRLMREMRNQGHSVEMLCQPHAELANTLREDGFTVHTFSMEQRFTDFWKNLLPIKRLIQERGYDVVNTNSRKDTIHVGAAARLAKKPLVVRTRHLAKSINSLLSYNWIPHRVITASHFVRDMVIQRGMKADHVDVVYPAVSLPTELPKQILREELGLAANDIVVGSIGALRREKGFQELIPAMQPVIQTNKNVHLVIIGGGGAQIELEAQANELGIGNNVHLLGERHDVPNLIGDFDIFALATHIESAGAVFAEAAATKLPTVGFDTTGVPEMMNAGVSGFLTPLLDINALSQAIQTLVDDPNLRKKMGEAGFQYAITENRFTLSALQKNTERSYRRWMEQRS